MKKFYCVSYKVCGIHHIFRCCAKNAREARKIFKNSTNAKDRDIVEVYKEQEWLQ